MAEHITADSTVNTEAARWQQLSRVTGIAGLAFFALTVAWIVTTSVSGKEPAFDGTADEVLAYFRATSSALAGFGSYLVVVGMVAMIWFAIGLAATWACRRQTTVAIQRRGSVCSGLRRPGPEHARGGSVVSRADAYARAGHLRVRCGKSGVRERLGGDGQLPALRWLGDDQHPLRTALAGVVGCGGRRRPGAEPSGVDE